MILLSYNEHILVNIASVRDTHLVCRCKIQSINFVFFETSSTPKKLVSPQTHFVITRVHYQHADLSKVLFANYFPYSYWLVIEAITCSQIVVF